MTSHMHALICIHTYIHTSRYALAWELRQRRDQNEKNVNLHMKVGGSLEGKSATRVVGFTSARNVAFVESLGVYDAVMTYDDAITSPVLLPASEPAVIVASKI